jgi:NAD-dependent dihydropyrimidine dehydrogenase PreA subunit
MSFSTNMIEAKVLIWGDGELARAVVSSISKNQRVIWVRNHGSEEKPDGVDEVLDQAALIKIEGTNGNFMVVLENGCEIVAHVVGAIFLFQESGSDLLDRLEETLATATPSNIVILLNRLSAGGFRAALNKIMGGVLKGHRIYVITDEVQVSEYGGEELYQRARDAGVIFFKDAAAEITGDGSSCEVVIRDSGAKDSWSIEADFVVRGDCAPSGQEWGDMLKIMGINRQIQENYPVYTLRQGIYAVDQEWGETSGPETVAGLLTLLALPYARGSLPRNDKLAVQPELCALCLTCYRVCPHRAVEFGQPAENLYGEAMFIDPLACDGCGLCQAECPAGAIVNQAEEGSPALILACEHAAGPLLRASGWDYRLFPCAGNIGIGEILNLAAQGATRIKVMACHEGKCRHDWGNTRLRMRAQRINQMFLTLHLNCQIDVISVSAQDIRSDSWLKAGEGS